MSKGRDDDDVRAIALAVTEEAGAPTEPRRDGPVVVQRRSIGRFRIDAELGSGGMADVYRAYDPVLDRAVALKVLHTKRTEGDTQGMRRVLREARAAAALTHPNTVTIFDVGEADGEVFIAMELLEGSVLRDVIDAGKASVEEKLRWLLQAARALAAAHERGLVHRDVKPENMFVCADGSLKLLDFGIAKRDDDDGAEGEADPSGPSSLRTQAGRRLGTPRYMAPEQHAGLATDARTDEYAWGLVAFELLCGSHVAAEQPTVTADGELAPAGASAAMRVAELRAKLPDLPQAVATSIARALETNMDDRFPSLDPIIVALETKTTTEHSPTRGRPRAWLLALAAASGIVTVLALTMLRERAASGPSAIAAKPPNGFPAACRTVSSRSIRVGPRENLTVLPNGAVVLVPDPSRGLKVERETPSGGRSPFTERPIPPVEGLEITELRMAGVMRGGVPSVVIATKLQGLEAVEPRGMLFVLGEDGGSTVKVLAGVPMDFAAASFRDAVVTVVAAMSDSPRDETGPGALLHIVGGSRVMTIEGGNSVFNPAVAATPTRLGIAYQHGYETHFALFDEELNRIGDVMTSMSFPAPTAVAFAGTTPVLFWTDTGSKKTRLHRTTLTPGDAAFASPTQAVDEPLVDMRPVTVRLPDGSFAVAWLTSNGGPPTLRVSPIGARGALTGPSDVATGTVFRGLGATATPQGIAFSWTDGAGEARIAHVTCQPPAASLPDR